MVLWIRRDDRWPVRGSKEDILSAVEAEGGEDMGEYLAQRLKLFKKGWVHFCLD